MCVAALCVDLAVMLFERLRGRSARHAAAVLAGAVLLAIALEVLVPVAPEPEPDPAPYAIVPPWYVWPMYALWRCMPDKLLGLGLVFAALVLPAVWAWVGADRIRTGRARWVWPVLCAGLGGSWVWLGLLGGQVAEKDVIVTTRAVAAGYFAFFLVLPLVLPRLRLS